MGGHDRAASSEAPPDADVDPDRGRARLDGGLESARAGRAGEPRTATTARQLLWFGALWLAGVGTVTLVAWLIRAVIVP